MVKSFNLISAIVAEALVRAVLAVLAVVAVSIEAVQVSERRNQSQENALCQNHSNQARIKL